MKPTKLLRCSLVLLTVATSASTAFATGLLGKRYASLNYDYIATESDRWDNGDGLSLTYNQPWNDKSDIGFVLERIEINSGREGVLDVTRTRAMVYGTGIGMPDSDVPFARVDLGWGQDKTDAVEESGMAYAITLGGQWDATPKIAVTLYAGWTGNTNSDIDGNFEYGLSGHFDLGDLFGLLVKVEGDEHYNFAAGIGVAARF